MNSWISVFIFLIPFLGTHASTQNEIQRTAEQLADEVALVLAVDGSNTGIWQEDDETRSIDRALAHSYSTFITHSTVRTKVDNTPIDYIFEAENRSTDSLIAGAGFTTIVIVPIAVLASYLSENLLVKLMVPVVVSAAPIVGLIFGQKVWKKWGEAKWKEWMIESARKKINYIETFSQVRANIFLNAFAERLKFHGLPAPRLPLFYLEAGASGHSIKTKSIAYKGSFTHELRLFIIWLKTLKHLLPDGSSEKKQLEKRISQLEWQARFWRAPLRSVKRMGRVGRLMLETAKETANYLRLVRDQKVKDLLQNGRAFLPHEKPSPDIVQILAQANEAGARRVELDMRNGETSSCYKELEVISKTTE